MNGIIYCRGIVNNKRYLTLAFLVLETFDVNKRFRQHFIFLTNFINKIAGYQYTFKRLK